MLHMHQPDGVLTHLQAWADGQEGVRAMLLTSTRAIPHATVDRLSDYDVILVVRDIRPFYEDRSWLQAFGEVLVGYWDPISPDDEYGFEQFGNVIQYADGLRIDFTLWPVAQLQHITAAPALPAELDAGYLVLLDKDGLAARMLPPTYMAYVPARPDAETYQKVIEDFFSDAPYVAKCLWRGDLLPLKWCLDYDMKHLFLRQMLEWWIECDQDWSVPTGALGKGLKKLLPPARWAQLENTYVGAKMEENWDALLRTLELFRWAAREVGAQLHYEYPEDLDQRVTSYVQQMRLLDRAM
jgi:aminoglycoside 6-adenylyltransferase